VPRDIFNLRDGDIFSSLLSPDMQTSKYLAARYLSAPEFFSSGGGWLNMKSSRVQVENLKIYSFSLWFRDKRGERGEGGCEEDRP
jgi:hypothetical protein